MGAAVAFRRTDPVFEPSLYQGQPPRSGNAVFQRRDKVPETAPAIQMGRVQRQNACTNRRQFGAIRTEPGNLRLRRTAWWSWEDSNLQPSGYCQEMGEAQCNHSDNIDHRLTKKTLAAISVGETVGPLSCGSAKYWSEWQDLNLRPPRPNAVCVCSRLEQTRSPGVIEE
jgi:hypothetical protein